MCALQKLMHAQIKRCNGDQNVDIHHERDVRMDRETSTNSSEESAR